MVERRNSSTTATLFGGPSVCIAFLWWPVILDASLANVKLKHLLLFLLVLFCLELSFSAAPFIVWVWLQVTLVAAVFVAGAITWMWTKGRGVSPLLLSSAVVAGLAAVAVYWIFPLIHTPAASSA